MIPRECKRLAEVDFPIAEVSKHSVNERPVVARHPQSLHQWWARRPLAACRAVLLALLLPDPCDPLCPPEFKDKARRLLAAVPRPMRPSVEPPMGCNRENDELRRALTRFIGYFVSWDLTARATYLEIHQGLFQGARGEESPLYCGG